MTLIKQESHILTCDSCGYEMQIDGKFDMPKGWYEYGMVDDYCPDCHIVDEDGKVIIRKKEETPTEEDWREVVKKIDLSKFNKFKKEDNNE